MAIYQHPKLTMFLTIIIVSYLMGISTTQNTAGYTPCPLSKVQCYHGTCKSSAGFKCVCTLGWVGVNCNTSCPAQCPKNCSFVNQKTSCILKCPVNATHNFTGPNCTIAVPISTAPYTTCQFSGIHCYHGTCAPDGLFCDCTPGAGYVSVNCNTSCPAQCPNNCSFINQQATCKRICPLNRTHRTTGPHCEIVVRIGPCPSNATHRFTGKNCEIAERICSVCPVCPMYENDKAPNSIAVPTAQVYTTCKFSGIHCYHGICASDGVFCVCTPGAGYVGANCNTSCPTQCPKNCSFINQQATCKRICPLNRTHRTTGPHCEIVVRIGSCPSNATHRFTGKNCEIAERICPVCPVCPTTRSDHKYGTNAMDENNTNTASNNAFKEICVSNGILIVVLYVFATVTFDLT